MKVEIYLIKIIAIAKINDNLNRNKNSQSPFGLFNKL